MVLMSLGLAWLSGLDLVTPATLLLFTFLIGVGTALTGPAWQSSVRGIVPQAELAAAVTLNAIAMNFARAVGPAVGGAVVAAAGAGAAFYLNAACTLVLAGALLWWPHHVPSDDLPRERVGSAIVTGLRYVAEATAFHAPLAGEDIHKAGDHGLCPPAFFRLIEGPSGGCVTGNAKVTQGWSAPLRPDKIRPLV